MFTCGPTYSISPNVLSWGKTTYPIGKCGFSGCDRESNIITNASLQTNERLEQKVKPKNRDSRTDAYRVFEVFG